IIMSPETPKWRSQVPMEQNELLEDELLSVLIQALSKPNSNDVALDKELEVATTGVFCFYLPLMFRYFHFIYLLMFDVYLTFFVTASTQNTKISGDVLAAIQERTKAEPDCKQALEFLLNAYRDCADMQKTFAKTLTAKERESLKAEASALELSYIPRGGRGQPKKKIKNTYVVVQFNYEMQIMACNSAESTLNTSSSQNLERATVIQKEAETAISCFKNIFKNKVKPGTEIKINEKSNIRDPVKDNAPPLSRIEIRKVIQSNSKPLLVDLYVSAKQEYLSSTVILKQGDDLRIDAAVLQLFRLFNKIWREAGLEYNDCPVRAHYYKCVAMAPDFGCIELIPGCKPLRLVGEIDEDITVKQLFNLIASSAGSYIASFVMGIRDRHFDNVLIRASDCTLFHIDFGYVLGKSVSIDTSKFAITQDLKRLMSNYWPEFIQLGVRAYLILRARYQEILAFAKMAFCYLVEPEEVEEFFQGIFHVEDQTEAEAARYIAKKIKESPDSVRTKFKNVVHQIATQVKTQKREADNAKLIFHCVKKGGKLTNFFAKQFMVVVYNKLKKTPKHLMFCYKQS
ncbi:hypothetical protein RFI_08755, partial [Reticulomyxa filosa]